MDTIEYWSPSRHFRTTPPVPVILTQGTYRADPTTLYPRLTWTTPDWCGLTYGLYKYVCSHKDCVPGDCNLTGTLVYSGPNAEYVDQTFQVGSDSCTTAHYYVKTTAPIDGSFAISNKVYYGQGGPDPTKAGLGSHAEHEAPNGTPDHTALLGSYPNPFNPSTTFEYQLLQPGYVSLVIYNVLGEEVGRLVAATINTGYYKAKWDADREPSGIFYAHFRVTDASGKETYSKIAKILLLK